MTRRRGALSPAESLGQFCVDQALQWVSATTNDTQHRGCGSSRTSKGLRVLVIRGVIALAVQAFCDVSTSLFQEERTRCFVLTGHPADLHDRKKARTRATLKIHRT